MLLDRWRARRALLTRSNPSSVEDPAPEEVRGPVEELGARLGATHSLGDPLWHCRWDGTAWSEHEKILDQADSTPCALASYGCLLHLLPLVRQ